MRWCMPHVFPFPGAQFLCWHQRNFGQIPSPNAKVLVLCIYLPTKGDGWPKAMRHENACLLSGQSMYYCCHCPSKGLRTFYEIGGPVTHTLQVLHTLLWQQPSKNERALPYSRPHPCLPHLNSHAMWWCSWRSVRPDENTALLSDCGLAGRALSVPQPALGGKQFSVCVNCVSTCCL